MIKKNILVRGGCRSGKSRNATSLAKQFPGRKVYLATAESLDKEMAHRIAKHKEDRGLDWITIEEPIDISSVLEREGDTTDIIVVDCLTLWISNLLMQKRSASYISRQVEELLNKCLKVRCH